MNPIKEPLVSVIIPTFNSARTLSKCLGSLRQQNYRMIEILVVDNQSKDGTVEIARMYGAKVYSCDSRRAAAKNYGLQNAKGAYVLFVDSDMELQPSVVKDCVNVMESNSAAGGVIIPERSVGNNTWSKARDFERTFYIGSHVESARFFRSIIAQMVGGYDEDVEFFEESTLAQKIEMRGYKTTLRIKSFIYHLEQDFSLKDWLRKKYYYGKTSVVYLRRYNQTAKYQIGVSSRMVLFLSKKRFYSNPKLATTTILLKAMEFTSVTLGRVTSIVDRRRIDRRRIDRRRT